MSGYTITNARIVAPGESFLGSVRVQDGKIAGVDAGVTSAPGAEDWNGDYLIPGLVELHTDNLEKHLEPRPGVRWPAMSALLTHDAQVSSAGITTVLDAMGIGDFDERSVRATGLRDATEALAHARSHGVLRAEHLLHMRCEIACDNVVEVVEPYLDDPSVRLVSLMDHTPGQRQWMDVEKFRVYTQRNQKWSDEYLAEVVQGRLDMQARNSARNRARLLELCGARRLPLASHDDTVPEHVEEAVQAGFRISEFPTTEAAARAARAHGLGIVMGAPNVVRGGSHSGNISAIELARADLLDVLSSDYVPHSLLHAAFMLRDEAGWGLPKALATTTRNPARLVGLDDRGEIAPGRRADYVRVRETRGVPVPLETYREGRRIA
ncbi:MAG TPA: alpha-D-ribose 1-methylphosphonate 5-triphosphate diphosphatase [Burkholderiales bacterium]|nr:alpha-D-ribose 1-methylphosphonate 5-triphosphate diphosphatase [Burkholderiales bacterium]